MHYTMHPLQPVEPVFRYSVLGANEPPSMARARELQKMLNAAYKQAADPTASPRYQRQLDKKITAMECELDSLLNTNTQAETPGGYYTSQGVKKATGSVTVEKPALVLGKAPEDEKRNRWPWILGIAAAGTATYFTLKG